MIASSSRLLGALLSGVTAFACASSGGAAQAQKLADGSYQLHCATSLQKCLDSANTLCKGATYDVLRARDQHDRLGGELGQSNVEVRSSEALIRCAPNGEPPPAPAPEPTWKLPPPAHAAQEPKAPAAAPPPERSCVPGSTQACVGPGACQGGQACLPSGAGFAPCDCGGPSPLTPPERPPAPLPTTPAEPLHAPPHKTHP